MSNAKIIVGVLTAIENATAQQRVALEKSVENKLREFTLPATDYHPILIKAAELGCATALGIVLEKMDPSIEGDDLARTQALHAAIHGKHLDAVTLLLERGADAELRIGERNARELATQLDLHIPGLEPVHAIAASEVEEKIPASLDSLFLLGIQSALDNVTDSLASPVADSELLVLRSGNASDSPHALGDRTREFKIARQMKSIQALRVTLISNILMLSPEGLESCSEIVRSCEEIYSGGVIASENAEAFGECLSAGKTAIQQRYHALGINPDSDAEKLRTIRGYLSSCSQLVHSLEVQPLSAEEKESYKIQLAKGLVRIDDLIDSLSFSTAATMEEQETITRIRAECIELALGSKQETLLIKLLKSASFSAVHPFPDLLLRGAMEKNISDKALRYLVYNFRNDVMLDMPDEKRETLLDHAVQKGARTLIELLVRRENLTDPSTTQEIFKDEKFLSPIPALLSALGKKNEFLLSANNAGEHEAIAALNVGIETLVTLCKQCIRQQDPAMFPDGDANDVDADIDAICAWDKAQAALLLRVESSLEPSMLLSLMSLPVLSLQHEKDSKEVGHVDLAILPRSDSQMAVTFQSGEVSKTLLPLPPLPSAPLVTRTRSEQPQPEKFLSSHHARTSSSPASVGAGKPSPGF